MKYSDEKQHKKAEEEFAIAMVDYFKLLNDVQYLTPNTDELNTLTRQVEKLNKTLQKIKERSQTYELENI